MGLFSSGYRCTTMRLTASVTKTLTFKPHFKWILMKSDGFKKSLLFTLVILYCRFYVNREQGKYIRKYLVYMWLFGQMSLSVYTLACLLVWTSRNALGSCYQITSCGTVNYTDIFPNLYINESSPVGNKGTMSSNVYPSVSEDALSASSNPNIRETNCHSNVSCTLK